MLFMVSMMASTVRDRLRTAESCFWPQDPRHLIDGLAELVLYAVQLYETAGAAAFAPKKAAKGAAPMGEEGINLSDPFNRVYMARLCAAVCFSERGGGGVGGVAGSFYQMLTLLATRSLSSLTWESVASSMHVLARHVLSSAPPD